MEQKAFTVRAGYIMGVSERASNENVITMKELNEYLDKGWIVVHTCPLNIAILGDAFRVYDPVSLVVIERH